VEYLEAMNKLIVDKVNLNAKVDTNNKPAKPVIKSRKKSA